MKPLERLTYRFTFRHGMIVVAATMLLALAATAVGVSSAPWATADVNGTGIRPFRVDVPKADLDDLRRRLGATRWPTKELVTDRSQGVQLATLKELARYCTLGVRAARGVQAAAVTRVRRPARNVRRQRPVASENVRRGGSHDTF